MLYQGIEYSYNLDERYNLICFNGEDVLFYPKDCNGNCILGVSRVKILNSVFVKCDGGLFDIFELDTEKISFEQIGNSITLDANSNAILNQISEMVREIQRNIINDVILNCNTKEIHRAINDHREDKAPLDFSYDSRVILSLTQEENNHYGVCINGKRQFVSKNFRAMKFVYDSLSKLFVSMIKRLQL